MNKYKIFNMQNTYILNVYTYIRAKRRRRRSKKSENRHKDVEECDNLFINLQLRFNKNSVQSM